MAISDKLLLLNNTKQQIRQAIESLGYSVGEIPFSQYPEVIDSMSDLWDLIRALYGNGEQGAMYIPKPKVLGQQVLWQDVEGTVPVVDDGDPVGLMLDLSGNGNHASQSTSARRPVYRTDGELHWLEFSQDTLEFQNLGMLNGADSLSAFAALRYTASLSAERCVFRFSVASTNTSTRFQIEGGRSNGKLNVAARRRDADRFEYLNTDSSYSSGEDLLQAGMVDFTSALARIRINGVNDGEDLDYLSPGLVDDVDSAGARLGSAASGSSQYFIGRIYGICINAFLPQMSTTEATEKYLASLAGITLEGA